LPYGEHNFNVSTFTARVVTSTLPDIYNAGTAVIGAFQRPLHSYRPGPWLMPAPRPPTPTPLNATQRAGARSVVGHLGAGGAGTR
jgi:hypothetical protein